MAIISEYSIVVMLLVADQVTRVRSPLLGPFLGA